MDTNRFWILLELMLHNFNYDEKEAFIGFLRQHLTEKDLNPPHLHYHIKFGDKFWEYFDGNHKIYAVKELRGDNAPWMTLRLAIDIYHGLRDARLRHIPKP